MQGASELYINRPEPKEAILQALLRLQLQMNEISVAFREDDQYRAFLSERVPNLIKEMRKYPLTLAAKHDISGFQALWRYSEIINGLEKCHK